jgi:hypothetical protein
LDESQNQYYLESRTENNISYLSVSDNGTETTETNSRPYDENEVSEFNLV